MDKGNSGPGGSSGSDRNTPSSANSTPRLDSQNISTNNNGSSTTKKTPATPLAQDKKRPTSNTPSFIKKPIQVSTPSLTNNSNALSENNAILAQAISNSTSKRNSTGSISNSSSSINSQSSLQSNNAILQQYMQNQTKNNSSLKSSTNGTSNSQTTTTTTTTTHSQSTFQKIQEKDERYSSIKIESLSPTMTSVPSSLTMPFSSTNSPVLQVSTSSLKEPDFSLESTISSNSSITSQHLLGGSSSSLNVNLHRSLSPLPNSILNSSGRRTPLASHDSSNNIQVICRFRPETTAELSLGMSEQQEKSFKFTVNKEDGVIQYLNKQNLQQETFKFNRVYTQDTSQEQIYKEHCPSLVDNLLSGYNVSVICYGQALSGKTYTCQGYNYSNRTKKFSSIGEEYFQNGNEFVDKYWGLTPRIVRDLFERIESMKDKYKFAIKVSYLLINNRDKLHDLQKPDLASVNDMVDISSTSVYSFHDVLTIFSVADRNLAKSDIASNSRRHAIFIVNMTKEDIDGLEPTLNSTLYMVDLASSEKADGLTQPEIKQASSIGSSLFFLGGVINDIITGAQHIRYRECVLTRVLSDSFGGNSKTLLVITCSGSQNESVVKDNLSVLEFGRKGQMVKNKPLANIEKSKQQLESENQKMEKLINSVGTIHGFTGEALTQYINHLMDEQKLNQDEKNQLSKTVVELQKEIDVIANDLEKSKQAKTKYEKLYEKENQDLEIYYQSKIEDLEKNMESLNGQIQDQNKYIDQAKKLESEKDNQSNLLLKANSQIQKWENDYTKVTETITHLESEKVTLRTQLEEKQKLLNQLEVERKASKDSSQLFINEKINSLELQVQQSSNELTSLHEQLETSQNRIHELDQQLIKSKAEYSSVQNDYSNIQNQFQDYRIKYSSEKSLKKKKKNQELKEKVTLLQQQMSSTNVDILNQQLKSHIDSETKLKTDIQTLQQNYQKHIQTLESTIQKQTQQLISNNTNSTSISTTEVKNEEYLTKTNNINSNNTTIATTSTKDIIYRGKKSNILLNLIALVIFLVIIFGLMLLVGNVTKRNECCKRYSRDFSIFRIS
ncbi:kinesin family member 9 [Tieghemostelium lacteum]|uniref:Kinesin family member 9 n=1 Tax=Tieghemostelium lacteum TaxID=361077 RepID=A0A152A991_TIELA|nr:kinesin family member 9 [Tieghemostelium lacteum]|eukprot:KYR02786.1 kinesin family member 9 [Tieghemostelium lacteum]